jgi:F0F1-type ATP synthase assembly protein I
MAENQEELKKEPRKAWYVDALQMFTKLSGWVLVPLVVGYTLGSFLDRKYNSEPKWFFISIGLAFIISTIGIVYQAQSEYKKIIPPKK